MKASDTARKCHPQVWHTHQYLLLTCYDWKKEVIFMNLRLGPPPLNILIKIKIVGDTSIRRRIGSIGFEDECGIII